MPRGRPPKPTRLKILTGNPGKRPLNAEEPHPSAAIPVCPAWLDSDAVDKWDALAPELARLGLLTIIDGDALAVYCQAYAEFKHATETLRREGRFVKAGGEMVVVDGKLSLACFQLQPHPAVAQQRSAWSAIKSFAALFGLDPSSRSRLHVGKGEDLDEMAEFLSKSGS
jgi:P27 family predicted phage terminase small subunit